MFLILSCKLCLGCCLIDLNMFPIFLSISITFLILSYCYQLYSSLSYRFVDIKEHPSILLFSHLKYFNITCQ